MKTATPETNLRTQAREATRRNLLSAGLRVVSRHGFAGASTAAIARATGKAHGTVFAHFQTRDALVAELVAEVGRSMSQHMADVSRGQAQVGDVLDAHLAALAEHEVLYAHMLGEAITLPATARAHIFALQTGVGWRLRTAIEAAVAGNKARALDPVLLVNSWIALTNHYVMNRDLFAPQASVIAMHGAKLKAHFLNLLAP